MGCHLLAGPLKNKKKYHFKPSMIWIILFFQNKVLRVKYFIILAVFVTQMSQHFFFIKNWRKETQAALSVTIREQKIKMEPNNYTGDKENWSYRSLAFCWLAGINILLAWLLWVCSVFAVPTRCRNLSDPSSAARLLSFGEERRGIQLLL